jgi:hypothetical protein
MSYDVSEQAADDTSGWTAPTGPRHRYDPTRAGGTTGGYPVPPPSIAAQLRPAPGWNGGTSGHTATAHTAPGAGSWGPTGSPSGEWLSPTRGATQPASGPVPAARPGAAHTSPEWVQTPGGEWIRAEASGDWAATASGEWQPVTRRLGVPEPATVPAGPPEYAVAGQRFGAEPAARLPDDRPGRSASSPGYGTGHGARSEQRGWGQPEYPQEQGWPQPDAGSWPDPGTRAGVEPGPPAPSAGAEPVYRSHDPAAADLRSQVVRRVRFMNFRHAEHAWERRYRDPIGPHALAFLYAEPARGKPPRYALKTATRLFLAGPEVDDLPQLLADLTDVVARALHGRLDCRFLADRTEDMSAGANYVGIAVSSLDTPAGRWADVRQRVAGSIDVPGRCYCLLSDSTMLLMDRGGQSRFGHFEVRSTDSLDEVPGDSLQRWTYDRSLVDLSDPATRDVWVRLNGLHEAIVTRGHR